MIRLSKIRQDEHDSHDDDGGQRLHVSHLRETCLLKLCLARR